MITKVVFCSFFITFQSPQVRNDASCVCHSESSADKRSVINIFTYQLFFSSNLACTTECTLLGWSSKAWTDGYNLSKHVHGSKLQHMLWMISKMNTNCPLPLIPQTVLPMLITLGKVGGYLQNRGNQYVCCVVLFYINQNHGIPKLQRKVFCGTRQPARRVVVMCTRNFVRRYSGCQCCWYQCAMSRIQILMCVYVCLF